MTRIAGSSSPRPAPSAGTTRAITAVMSRTMFRRMTAALAFPASRPAWTFRARGSRSTARDARLVRRARYPDGLRSGRLRDSRQRQLFRLSRPKSEARSPAVRRTRSEAGRRAGTGTTTGAGTIRSDGTLTSPGIADFVARATIIGRRRQSTPVLPTPTRSATSWSACPADGASPVCWGTTDSPKIVYVGGALSPRPARARPSASAARAVGAGILIVENAAVEIDGNFRWNGLVVVTGPRHRDPLPGRRNAGGVWRLHRQRAEPRRDDKSRWQPLEEKTHILYSKSPWTSFNVPSSVDS